METGEEITVKRLWCIFIVGVPWKKKKKKKKKKVFYSPVSPLEKKGKGTKGRKNNCSVVTALFTSPTEMRSKYGSNYSFT